MSDTTEGLRVVLTEAQEIHKRAGWARRWYAKRQQAEPVQTELFEAYAALKGVNQALATALARLEAAERALRVTYLAYRELSLMERDRFSIEELTAWRILNDVWFKDLFGVADLSASPAGEEEA